MASAIDQIIRWAQSLPGWQADCVRRLLQHGELTISDRSDLYEMLKVFAGIETGCGEPAFPKVGGFSGSGKGQQAITLERILDIHHVNAIKNGSTIPFGLQGITVVYGQNGSGKSSYARILKRACRARDTKEPIHSNVFDSNEKGPATATIKITEGSATGISLPWTDGEGADERLAGISFFDSKCARVIVDENNEAVYIPYGCHVFDGLVELMKAFRERLQSERPRPKEPRVAGLVEGTRSFVFLQQLSRNTTAEDIAAATKWTPEDEGALTDVTARVAQSKTRETLEKARRLRSAAARSCELADAIDKGIRALSAEVVAELNGNLEAVRAAKKAVHLSAQTTLQGEPLPAGTSESWRLLYEAAREYSISVAYPGKSFPATAANDRCVLCQQLLLDEAEGRLQRFKQFMEDKSEQTLRKARSDLASCTGVLQQLQLPRAEDYGNVLDELSPEARRAVESTMGGLLNKREQLLSSTANDENAQPFTMTVSAKETLVQLRNKLESLAAQAEADADPGALRTLETLRDELNSRKGLSQIRPEIQSYVEEKRLEFKYDQCAGTLSTRAISEKSKEIISAALSPQLQGDLKRELTKLGATHLPLNVSITGREGGARHQLTLDSARRTRLSEVLSEGEQCVVAIAGFLAELGGAPALSPIVLDDPVTSLDHRFSRYVAQRLVEEAKKRQVIVFTHNIAFLVEIEKHSAGASLCVQTIQRTGSGPGHCMEGVPWEAMSVIDRLNYIEGRLAQSGKLHGLDDNEYNSKVADLYGLLRQTWEAFIEREILNQTVLRHDTDVQTKRLMQVEILDEDCARIQRGMSKCSTWMAGHDKSMGLDVNRPPPSEFRDDVQELRAFVKRINKRREEVRERRKALLEPHTPQLG